MAGSKGVVSEFKDFVVRGDVLDLAIAVVIGAAFGTVVTALVKDLLTPIVAAIFGKPEFSTLSFTIHHSKFAYGDFINAIIAFLTVAAAIFFVVVKPINALRERRKQAPEPDSDDRPCPECLSQTPRRPAAAPTAPVKWPRWPSRRSPRSASRPRRGRGGRSTGR